VKSSACLSTALVLLLASCGTRTIKTPIVDTPALQVTLRHQRENGVAVERSFQHPATISRQRLVHILGAIDIDIRKDGEKKSRVAAIHPELLEPISSALVDAFERADSTQEVTVIAVRKQQRLGIFHKKFLTTLIAYFREDRLYLHLSRVEWEIPRDRENKVMPEPQRGEKQMAFRTVAIRKMAQAGSQGVAVRWRDNLFSAPVRTASEAGGARRERTILLESPIPTEELDDETRIGLDGIEPEVLRAWADLAEARRSGAITETEYRQRRENLLGLDGY
jgi:hypothetical protein